MLPGLESRDFVQGDMLLRYYHRQRGLPNVRLVLIHGLGTTAESWSRLIPLLPEDLELFVLDIPGHGGSTMPVGNLHSDMLTVVEAFVSSLGPDLCLMGHSYGGWLALNCALSCRNVTRLILEDSTGLASFFSHVQATGGRESYVNGIKEKLASDGKETASTERLLHGSFDSRHLAEKELAGIRVPTLIIWGSEDTRIPLRFANEFRQHIRGSGLSLVKGARHTPHYTHAGHVSRAVTAFLNDSGDPAESA